MSNHRLWLTTVFALMFGWAHAHVIIDDSTKRIFIGKSVKVLIPGEELSLDQVIRSEAFVPCEQDIPNLGFSTTSVWLSFTLDNRGRSSDFLLEVAYPILDEVELFMPTGEPGQHKRVTMGEIRPFASRQYKHPNYVFDIPASAGASETYYLRVKSAEQLILPISVNRPTTLWEALSMENLLTGIFIGSVLIMVFYNLFIFFSVKDKSYLYYVFYVACVGLTQVGIKGYSFQFLWPNSPGFEMKSVILFACVGAIAAILFTRSFLSTRSRVPKFDYVLLLVIVLQASAFLVTAIGYIQPGFQLMQGATTLFSFSLLIVSALVWRKGYKPAQFVFYSWSVLLLGAVIFTLKDNGVIRYNLFTSYSMQLASSVEMALLSFALANKINIYRKEKDDLAAEALRVSRENETLIREQNVVLEQKVTERTHELKQSNDTLQKTLVDLKEAQSQLVESEKMASLGQLTAGVAHEINNPINFVTSNVTPLRRDLGMVLDTLDIVEKIGLSELPAAEKQQQIAAYKEELDFDYLKEEINHLLNGMYEGATRTSEIVKSLRIFSRVDEDALKMADINECLDSTLVIVNSLINDKGIRVEKNFARLPQVECYPGKLNQVFLNIISNAIYAIDKQHNGDRNGLLSISTSLETPDVIISIRDNGMGMDEKTKDKMFEPFFTTKDVGEGTGLGMSIAYNTIKKHNGEVIVNTAPGQGAKFILKIPLQQKNK